MTAEERAFQRLYGPWAPWGPQQARDVLDPIGIPWWVAGGWAIEAYTGIGRDHEDIDISVLRRDLPSLQAALSGRLHVWAAGAGGLTPLDDKQMTMPDTADQVWLRAHALSPWLADVLLNPDDDRRWVFRRDPTYVVDLDPEVVLAFKAKRTRAKDERDFDATTPLLDAPARAWLADFLARCHPDHAWRARL